MKVLIVISLALTSVPPAVAADRKGREQAMVFRALLECRGLREDGARLACYDNKTASLATAEESGDVVIADRTQMKEAGKQVFGFGGIRIPFLSGDDANMPSSVSATLSGLRDLGYGKWEFTLDNGMRWRQTDDDVIFPKVGQPVVVRNAAMGSYILKVKGGAVRVVRTR